MYKQLTGKAKSQQGFSEEFKCKMTPFKHLITGEKQPGRPGRGKFKSSKTVAEVQKLESEPASKRQRPTRTVKKQ